MCGITRQKDVNTSVSAGADALGFVFYKKSSRFVTLDVASRLILTVPPFVTSVGLFVNATHDEILKTTMECGLHVVQLHGDETVDYCRSLTKKPGFKAQLIKAVRVETLKDLHNVEQFAVSGILLDAKVENQYGGTGKVFDWSILKTFHCQIPLILAGGLHAENVLQAIDQVAPFAVDVSSGVEAAPGIKDADKIYRFVRQVRKDKQE